VQSAETIPWWERVPDRRTRLIAALVVACVAVATFLLHTTFGAHYVLGTGGDFGIALDGARRMLDGQRNIYATTHLLYGHEQPLTYPLPAMLVALPVAWLDPQMAAAIFVALSTGVAAYALTQRRLSDLLVFASAPAVVAWCWAQWSPLLLIQGVTAASVVVGLAKPQLGAVMFALRPNWRGAGIGVLALLATLVWWPMWPIEWARGVLRYSAESNEYRSAMFAPGGFLLLAAALRWRAPRARMFLALTIVPVRLAFYDQLCLGLVADTPRRQLIWALCTWAGLATWWIARLITGGEAFVVRDAAVVVSLYGPALVFLLWPTRAPSINAA
jgi:GNAT superfamily N-acetyltransferase